MTQVEILDRVKSQATRIANGEINRADARLELKSLLKEIDYKPKDPDEAGTIKDLRTDRRLNLILDTPVDMARGYGQWQAGQSPAILKALPVQELIRVGGLPNAPRPWREKWAKAGGSFFGGRMMAMKDDGIWTRPLSSGGFNRFGNDYGPFDYLSGMRTRDVTRREAKELGMKLADQKAKVGGFNEGVAAGPKVASPELRRALEKSGLGKFEDGKFVMTPEPSGGMSRGVNEPRKEKGSDPPLPPKGGKNGARPQGGLRPGDVGRGILAAITAGSQGSTFAQARREREFLMAGGLPKLEAVDKKSILAKGKEHLVTRKGTRVWKYQEGPALIPISRAGKLAVREALSSEYLARLELQNRLFEDDVLIEGVLASGKLVSSQAAIRGGEPSETEVEALLTGLGWKRFPMNRQLLPHNLMATAWAHPGEGVVLVDARPPNFKKAESGVVLAIDLMLVKATGELLEIVEGL